MFTKAQVSFYEKEVLPVLTQHCLKCHGADPDKLKGDLNLTTRKGVLTGGETGPAVNLAKPADSLLVKMIHYKEDGYKMPPKGKMPDKDIATLEKWVKEGLPVPADLLGTAVAKKSVVTEEAKKYWAYQPVKRPAAPEVKNKEWVKNPIDAFVLAKLEAKGLKPVAPRDACGGSSGARTTTSPAFRRHRKKWTRSSRARTRTLTKSSSTSCSRRRSTVRSGAGTGST